MTMQPITPIPVILDTDIGTDIDDTWALALLLRSPELDLRLVSVTTGDPVYRARLAARVLEAAGRADVPIALGAAVNNPPLTQRPWADAYDLRAYPGRVYSDAVEVMIETVMSSPTPVTILSIAPMTDLARALAREPRIADNARVVAMCGSIARNFDGADGAVAEWNVEQDLPSAMQVFAAPWPISIAPLDPCGVVRLPRAELDILAASPDPLSRAVMDCYRVWLAEHGIGEIGTEEGWFHGQPHRHSAILYDTVAVYLSYADDLLITETQGLTINPAGFTVPDANARPVRCALGWRDLPAFRRHLIDRLTARERECAMVSE